MWSARAGSRKFDSKLSDSTGGKPPDSKFMILVTE